MKQDIVVCRRVKCTYIKEVLKIKHLKCYEDDIKKGLFKYTVQKVLLVDDP